MQMNFLLIILRLIHLFSGVAWVGGGAFTILYAGPTAQQMGPEGGRFMQNLMGRASQFFSIVAGLTVLSGLALYWFVSGRLNPAWITSGTGLMLTIGGVAGLVAMIHGGAVLGRIGRQMEEIGKRIQTAGGPPTPEQMAEMGSLQESQRTHGAVSLILFALALIGMSVAQNVRF
jgi:hypothetical protein